VRVVLGIKLFLPLDFFLFGGLSFIFLFVRDQEMALVSQNLEVERKREGGENHLLFNSKREEEKGKGLAIILQNGASRILQIGQSLVT